MSDDENSSSNSDQFNDNVEELFRVLQDVQQTKEQKTLNLTSTNKTPITKYLENYIKAYKKTDPEDHKDYFLSVYKKNRIGILNATTGDKWLKEGSINVVFGNGEIKFTGNKQIKIMLSTIYCSALKLREQSEKDLEGLPDSAYEDHEELLYPERIILTLYRIFTCCNIDKNDVNKLRKKMVPLEQEIEDQEELTATSTMGSSRSKNKEVDNPMAGIMNMIPGMMKSMGVNLPKGQKMPDGNQLGDLFAKMMNSEQTKQIMGNMMAALNQDDGLKKAAEQMTKDLGNPQLGEKVSKMIDDAKLGELVSGEEGDPPTVD